MFLISFSYALYPCYVFHSFRYVVILIVFYYLVFHSHHVHSSHVNMERVYIVAVSPLVTLERCCCAASGVDVSVSMRRRDGWSLKVFVLWVYSC